MTLECKTLIERILEIDDKFTRKFLNTQSWNELCDIWYKLIEEFDEDEFYAEG